MQLVLPRSLTSRREQALALQIMADQEREADLAQQERLMGDFELKDCLDQNEALTDEVSALSEELSAERDRLAASESLVKELTSERDTISVADSELQHQEVEAGMAAKDQIIYELERHLAVAEENAREAAPRQVAILEMEVASWIEECRTHQADSRRGQAAANEAESTLQTERAANEQIITGYCEAKDDVVAERSIGNSRHERLS